MRESFIQRLVSCWHSLDFWLRSTRAHPRRLPSPAEMSTGLPKPPRLSSAQQQRANTQRQRLASQHPALIQWPSQLPALAEAESLTILQHGHDWLLPAIGAGNTTGRPLRWLDIGSKNAAYAPGLATLALSILPVHGLQLNALELDGGRRYRDGYTRASYAHALLKMSQEFLRQQHPQAESLSCRYLQKDIRQHHEHYDVITWLMPFVFAKPHISWGLPLRYFDPQAMTDHVMSLLEPGATLMLIHLNQDEAQAQMALLHASCAPHKIIATGQMDDPWLYPDAQRQVIVIKRC